MNAPLPPLLRQIADVAGEPAARRIAEVRGGCRVWIPAKAGKNHWLVQAVGPEAAEKICEHFSHGGRGDTVEIPVSVTGIWARALQEVDELIRQGLSTNQIVQVTGVGRGTVNNRKRRMRDLERGAAVKPKANKANRDDELPPTQGDLFDG